MAMVPTWSSAAIFLNAGSGFEVREKIDVGVKTDSDSVNEDEWKLGSRGVRTMPVRKVLDRGSWTAKEGNWLKREECEEA